MGFATLSQYIVLLSGLIMMQPLIHSKPLDSNGLAPVVLAYDTTSSNPYYSVTSEGRTMSMSDVEASQNSATTQPFGLYRVDSADADSDRPLKPLTGIGKSLRVLERRTLGELTRMGSKDGPSGPAGPAGPAGPPGPPGPAGSQAKATSTAVPGSPLPPAATDDTSPPVVAGDAVKPSTQPVIADTVKNSTTTPTTDPAKNSPSTPPADPTKNSATTLTADPAKSSPSIPSTEAGKTLTSTPTDGGSKPLAPAPTGADPKAQTSTATSITSGGNGSGVQPTDSKSPTVPATPVRKTFKKTVKFDVTTV